MSKRKKGTCIYCGKCKKLTFDHVPPKTLFAPPRPAELVTVPCCEKCHRDTGKDDEYFRIMICPREDVYKHPEVIKGRASLQRAILDPAAKRFTNSIFGDMKVESVYSYSGLIYLGEKPIIPVKLRRIYNVVNRSVRGLYYHHERTILPPEYIIRSIAPEGLGPMKLKGIGPPIDVINALKTRPSLKIGDVLEYKYKTITSNHDISVWLLKFYGRVLFLTFTYPPGWVRPKDET